MDQRLKGQKKRKNQKKPTRRSWRQKIKEFTNKDPLECKRCKVEEDIPKNVVEYMDVMDDGDPTVPPRFSCEVCGGEMVPEKYNGVHGIKYEL